MVARRFQRRGMRDAQEFRPVGTAERPENRVHFSRASGTNPAVRQPAAEAAGYYQTSLRDEDESPRDDTSSP